MGSISKAQRIAHPNEPWLWREDWANRHIHSTHGLLAILVTTMAVIFLLFSIPLLIKAPDIARKEGLGIWLAAGLFPLAACGLLYWAMICIFRWVRFKKISFELTNCPGVVGGYLEGIIHVGRPIDPTAGFVLRLSCMQRYRSGRSNKTSTIWQEEVDILSAQTTRGIFGTKIPVRMTIPFEAESTSEDPSRLPNIQWRLEVLASLSGADLHAFFEVPVFKTETSSPQLTEHVELVRPDDAENRGSVFLEAETELARQGIQVTRSPAEGLLLEFPSRRNFMGAAVLTLFAAMWNGFVLWAASSVPGLFKLLLAPFALVGLILFVLVPVVWLEVTKLQATTGRLSIHRTILGFGQPRHIDAHQIESLLPEAQGGNAGRATFTLKAHVHGKRPRRLVGNLSKQEAEHISALLKHALAAQAG